MYYFYPDLDKEHAASLNFAERCMYIEVALEKGIPTESDAQRNGGGIHYAG